MTPPPANLHDVAKALANELGVDLCEHPEIHADCNEIRDRIALIETALVDARRAALEDAAKVGDECAAFFDNAQKTTTSAPESLRYAERAAEARCVARRIRLRVPAATGKPR